ncbi:MAG: 50S ribosomal protein L29 [Candidatus Levybacteria bacterium RIFCSPHIGHO2_02_FULL_42_12]|nr:MAG: 50S ribosomal protein L29 [Candidatus Levybacteria bacterium RIFCSPHIGHO2_01_FULL_42_15]OGH31419.1 MAG: 50S ribosomal protein L29 [Candidatus Levybacteria bacterium RIFCSPHIGHO2_02_FULL_42_12]OGH42683.1 MAG: 50S ribosomal protein L29 [Candidatus Levybacteria bacterium RIFCSPLOWO2_01_FULL_42_15]
MKKKDMQALRNKDANEFRRMIDEAKKELFKLKLDLSMQKLKNTRAVFEKRKDIARLLTLLEEKKSV